jgi:alanine dehydrogenase
MGAEITAATRSAAIMASLARRYGDHIRVAAADEQTIQALCTSADVIIGAALIAGGAAPKLVSARTVEAMKPGAVIVDVSIDQGGCVETSLPTTHPHPTYIVNGVLHYCVVNMPGAVPRTSTFALDNATRPFVLTLADQGFPQAFVDNAHLRNGLNVHDGKITCRAVADALQLPYTPAADVLSTDR